jgi:hypothetical protein
MDANMREKRSLIMYHSVKRNWEKDYIEKHTKEKGKE